MGHSGGSGNNAHCVWQECHGDPAQLVIGTASMRHLGSFYLQSSVCLWRHLCKTRIVNWLWQNSAVETFHVMSASQQRQFVYPCDTPNFYSTPSLIKWVCVFRVKQISLLPGPFGWQQAAHWTCQMAWSTKLLVATLTLWVAHSYVLNMVIQGSMTLLCGSNHRFLFHSGTLAIFSFLGLYRVGKG